MSEMKGGPKLIKQYDIRKIPGILWVCATALFFHVIAWFSVKSFYSTHLPHYDSMGAYEVMFRIIDKFHQEGPVPAIRLASSYFLSWLMSFFALIGAPILHKTPESLQLYNSFWVFLFMLSVYLAAKSAGAGNLKAYLLSLIVFLPDTFYNWQGGLMDLQRDPSFVSLLGATYFMLFAYIWRPATGKGIMLGILAGLTVLSRGNAIYLLAGIMGPIIGVWTVLRLRARDFSSIGRLVVLSGVPFAILAIPNVYYSFILNLKRYANPYSFAYLFGQPGSYPWLSLAAYWSMPLKIMFGSSYVTLFVTALFFGIIGSAFAVLRSRNLISVNRSFLLNRQAAGIVLSGLWTVVIILFLMCIVLKLIPLSYDHAKHPFYPSLLFFLSVIFVFGLSVQVNFDRHKKKWINGLSAALCLMALLLAAVRIEIRTKAWDREESATHIAVAHQLVNLFSNVNKGGKVAYIWYETITLDTLNYYSAQEGKDKINKFFYAAPDGHTLKLEVGTPPNTDVEALLATLKKQLEEKADFVVVNTNPGAYKIKDHLMFIFQYGQPVIDSILNSRDFRIVYEYELFNNKPSGGRFAVLENISKKGKI